jgi:hypothetical protein
LARLRADVSTYFKHKRDEKSKKDAFQAYCGSTLVRLPKNSATENCFAPKSTDFLMILGEDEAVIQAYYNEDELKSAKRTAFGLVRIILTWLRKVIGNSE